jgi:hypothetical protein
MNQDDPVYTPLSVKSLNFPIKQPLLASQPRLVYRLPAYTQKMCGNLELRASGWNIEQRTRNAEHQISNGESNERTQVSFTDLKPRDKICMARPASWSP